jgi:hypothetical protein
MFVVQNHQTMKKLLVTLLFLVPFLSGAQEVYHIKWISNDVYYSMAVIVYDDSTGKMRVRYDAGAGVKLVEMDVLIETDDYDEGFYIHGSNPKNALSAGPAGYNADHFYVGVNDDYEIYCTNSDDGDSNSKCCIMEVTGSVNQNVFLKEFNWTL